MNALAPGEQRSLDIASALLPGDDAVTLSGRGKKGASAAIMLWDGVSE